jgi:UDP-N-acetylglucosamine 4,6-dehydratase/5-epimerase
MPINSNSRILIAGGTDSFGKAFIVEIFKQYPDINRIVAYSRDEL